MRVWVTRAEPGASATAARLAELGHESVVAPVIGVAPIEGAPADLGGVGALAFTSANGVEAFAALNSARALPVFAVGDATAQAAREAGFPDVTSADGDVSALTALIVARRKTIRGVVLHPSALKPAGDLVGGLAAAGMEARRVALYDTGAAAPAVPEADAVLVHSPSAALALVALLSPDQAARLSVFALSQACAAPLAGHGFRAVAVSPFPREDALLKLVR